MLYAAIQKDEELSTPSVVYAELIPQFRGNVNLNVAKNPQDGPGGDTEEALWRNLLNTNHQRPLPLLDLTMGEVFHYPFNSNKTRIARP
jgi:hypothetical protein